MDGIPALTLWDLVIEIFHSVPNQSNKTKDVKERRSNLSATPRSNMRKQVPNTHTNIDLITLITFHRAEHILVRMLCCVSLNEAVIKDNK